MNDANVNRPGGATAFDLKWAGIRAKRGYPPIVPNPGPDGLEPFQRPDMKLWQLFTAPANGWVAKAQAVIDASAGTLNAPDDPALNSEVTIVTTLLDLGRGTDAGGTFKRSMKVGVMS